MTSTLEVPALERTAGFLLMPSGILIIGLITRHPTWSGGMFFIQSIHGLLMSTSLLMTAGFALFVLSRRSTLAVIGFIPYACAAAAGLGAALINGFIVPSLLADGVTAYADLLWTSNQMLAQAGIFAMAAAFTIWSIDLWQLGWRATCIAGLTAGLLPAALLLSGSIDTDIAGAIIAYSATAAWALWLGFMLWRSAHRSSTSHPDRLAVTETEMGSV
jgi:hypothetical protein